MATVAERKATDPSVAKPADNDKLEHPAGGVTTRDDANDLGVPMLPGDASEPQGPEDALGVGATRGDYSGRIGPESYHPHEGVRVQGKVVQDPQRGRVEQAEVAGVKGGTDLPK